MKLEHILQNLNKSNINQFIYMVKHSKCKNCQFVYENLINGNNLFDILDKITNQIGRILIKPKTIGSLNLLGSYMIYEVKFKHHIKLALSYPIILIIILNILIIVIHSLFPISKSIFLIQLLFIPMILYGIYIIKCTYKSFINTFLLRMLMYNEISLNNLQEIFHELSITITLNNIYNISNLTTQIIGIPCNSSEEIDVIFNDKKSNLQPLLERTCQWLNYGLLLIVGIIICCIFFNLYSNFMLHFMH